jgi:hypothetical protein
VRSLLEDRERASTIGATARDVFLKRFTLDRSIERMIEQLPEAVDHPLAPSGTGGWAKP